MGFCIWCGKFAILDTKRSSLSKEKFCSCSCYLSNEYTPHPMFTEKDWWNYGPGIISSRAAFVHTCNQVIERLKIFK